MHCKKRKRKKTRLARDFIWNESLSGSFYNSYHSLQTCSSMLTLSGHLFCKKEKLSHWGFFVGGSWLFSEKGHFEELKSSCTKFPWSFLVQNTRHYLACHFYSVGIWRHTHIHTNTRLYGCSYSCSHFLIKALTGLFSILMGFVILCQHLTSQAVGIRLIQREANRLWLTTAKDYW